MSRNPRTHQGFTLVELLVVIGIIAVLTAMLLPALNKARAQARLVECSARLRDIGVATHAYAAENRGQIPPTRADTGNPDYDYLISYHKNHDWTGGTPPQPEIRSNIGRLIFRKHLQDDRMTFCPLAPTSAEDDRYYDSQYAYNVHIKYVTRPSGRKAQVWWKKVTGFGKTPSGPILVATGGGDKTTIIPKMDRALASDPLGSGGNAALGDFKNRSVTHLNGNYKTYNLLFIDGSVRGAKMRSNITRDPMNSWARFLDMLGYSEAVINGTATAPPANNYNLAPVDI